MFRSPGFGCMVTPPWAKCGSSGASKTIAKTGPAAAQAEAEEEEEDRRHSVARRLDSAPTFADFAAEAAAAVQQAQQGQQGQQAQQGAATSLQTAPSFEFGALLGSPPKKSKVGRCGELSWGLGAGHKSGGRGMSSPLAEPVALAHGCCASACRPTAGPPVACKPLSRAPVALAALSLQTCSPPEASQATCATAGTPWMAHTSHTSLALAVQQHLLLASTAKAPAAAGALGAELRDKENGRGGTLTALKAGPAGGSAAADKEPISSSKVRQQLTALLDSV